MASRLKVTIIEDHDDLRHELIELFTADGHDVRGYRDAELLRHEFLPSDLYLVDIGLPGEDGLSLARWIRQKQKDARIFILTAHDENQRRIESFQIGVELFLAKPIDPAELKAAIKFVSATPDAQTDRESTYILDLGSGLLSNGASSVKLSASEMALVRRLSELRQLPMPAADVAATLNVAADQLHTGTLEARISILRRKFLEIGATRNVIAAVRKYGYKINVDVQVKSPLC